MKRNILIGWIRLAYEGNLYELVMEEDLRYYPSGIYGKGNVAEVIIEIVSGSSSERI